METLDQEKSRLEAEKADLVNNLEPGNQESIARLNQIDSRLYEIDIELKNKAREEAQPEILQTAVTEAKKVMFGGTEIQDPDLAELLQIAVSEAVKKANEMNEPFFQDKEDQIKALKDIIREKDTSIEDLHKEMDKKDNEIRNLIELKNDSDQKRDAAANELETLSQEIERLNNQIVEYQKAKVFGERDAQKIIDVTPNNNDRVQELINKINSRYIKSEDFGTLIKLTKEDGSFDVLKRSEAEQIPSEFLPVPNLPTSEVKPEGGSFPSQNQAENTTAAPEGTANVAETGVSETFPQAIGVPEVQQGAEPTDSGDNQPAVGTLEEAFKRIEALEKTVFKEKAA